MSTLLTVDEYSSESLMGDTGTKAIGAVQAAIDMAESDVSKALGFPIDGDGVPTFISHQFVEEHPWPFASRPLILQQPRLITVDEVLARHDIGDCDCEWTDLSGCAFVLDARKSEVLLRSCEWAQSCWGSCRCAQRVQVTYTAGFTAAEVAAATPAGQRLRLAIALRARAIMNLLDHNTEGDVAVSSYSSLGYSESREFKRTARGRAMGLSVLDQASADMLEPLVVKRGGAVMLRGH